ncbi:MAG TPA: hypothetical protein VNO25_11980, partial [Streptosporangiaceae bacterium]|nr:hypothetical protein [Streptosporangiaceae bacterium]
DDMHAYAHTNGTEVSRSESAIWPLLGIRDYDLAKRAIAYPGELNHELVCETLQNYPNGQHPLTRK